MKNGLMLCAAAALIAVGFATLDSSPAQAATPPEIVQSEMAAVISPVGTVEKVALTANKFQTNLTWDGGATGVTQVVCLNGAYQTVQMTAVTASQFCYKTCLTGTCVPDCTKDFVVNRPGITFNDAGSGTNTTIIYNSGDIPMGFDKCIVVSSTDAGNPNVNLYLVTKNPSAAP